MSGKLQTHYLRANHREWTPGSVIFLDTETRVVENTEPELHVLRLWAARHVDRRDTRAGRREDVPAWGRTSEQFVSWLDSRFVGRKTVWLFAHNLGFDLAVTRLPVVLADAGWQVTDASISGRAPWLTYRKGDRSLTLADSGSWLPYPLDVVGEALGIGKRDLPDSDDTEAAWLARCESDVTILAAAMLDLMGWWDESGLGNWGRTGAACGWSTYRHMPAVQRVTIDPTPTKVKADRLAVHGGRRGVWRVGVVRVGELAELDFVAAYPTVAAHLPLPLRRGREFDCLPVDDALVTDERWSILARVKVETDVPRWPVKWGGATWYPVGTFWTTLAGPDVNEAARLGCLREVGPGHVHQTGRPMAEWGHWVLRVQNGEDDAAPPVARLCVKAWGRSVIGKWGQRGFDKVELGPSPVLGWGYEPGWDSSSDCRGGMVDIGGRRWWTSAGADPDNAYPAVLAWVEAHTRVRLNRVVEALGRGGAIQCDTDGLLVTMDSLAAWAERNVSGFNPGWTLREAADAACDELSRLTFPLRLRVKRVHDTADILGPQHYQAGDQRRFAGVPRDAVRTARDTFTGRTWPKLTWQLQNGDPRGYVRPQVTAVLSGVYAPGWVTRSGRVLPVQAYVTRDGATDLLPYPLNDARYRAGQLAEVQHPALMPLLTDRAGVMPNTA